MQKREEKEPKILKHLTDLDRTSMPSLSKIALKDIIVESEKQQDELKEELDNNVQYQSARSVIKDLSAGQKGVKSTLKAKIKYALMLLEKSGGI